MAKQWTPPSDAAVTENNKFAPPSDAVEVKKKVDSQSTLDQGNTSSARLNNTTTKPTASLSSPEILTGYLGKSKKKYKFEDNQWYEENPKPQVAKSTPSKFGGTNKTYGQELKFNPNAAQGSWKPIEEESRIKALNYYYKKDGSLATEEKVFTNYDPEKKDNLYRIKNGQWERKVPKGYFAPVNDEIATQALNKRYGQNVVFTPTKPQTVKKEDPKFTDINSNLTAKTEEDAIGYLEKNYGKYGFEFNQEGLFYIDQIRVKTKDGKKEEVFEFDEKNPEEAARLKAFLEENKSKVYSGTYNYLDEKVRNQSKDIPKGEGRSQQEIQDYLKAVQIKKGEYILSDDYLNNFKKLDADEMKDQITNVIGKSGLNSKTVQEFYKTDAYKAYKIKKAEANKSEQEKINTYYDELKYAKLAGDNAKVKDAQNKIDAYLTNDVIADNVKNYDMQLNDLKNRNKQLETEYADYQKQVNKFNSDKTIIDQKLKSGEISQEQYNGMINGLNQRSDELNNLSENIQTKAQKIKVETDNVSTSQKKLNYVAGKYVAAKEKEGGAIGFAVNSVLNGVSGAFIEPFANYAALGNQYEDLSPEEKQYYKDKGYNKDQIENILDNKAILKAKNDAKEMLVSNVGFESTTKEYMKSSDRGFIATAIGGVLQSLPAMATGVLGSAASFTGLAAQAYSGIEEEMLNDPDFQTTSVGERSIIAIPYAVGMGILENYGLTNMIKGDSVTGRALQGLVTRTIANAPKGATQDMLNKLVAKEIESNIAKGIIKITQAGLAEFETGATQSLVLDQGLKQIYNIVAQRGMTADEKKNLSQGEFFDTADSFGELASQTFEDGLAEAIGGVTLGAVGTLSQRILKGDVSIYNADDVEFLKNVAQDDNFKKLFVANLKTSMLNGSMTKGQAQEKLDALNEIQAVFTKLPENISKDQVKQSMDLVVEKTKLEKEIAGKDPALVAAQTERINAINEELKTISQNAVQEQTTSEVSVQPGTEISGEVAQGESQAGSQVVTEEGQKEDQVAAYRAEEQAELLNAIPEIENYKVNGEIDKSLMPTEVLTKYDEIYNKYDELISPLLETTAQINVAPLFNTKVTNIEEARAIQDSDQYKQYKEKIGTVASDFGIKVDNIEDSIGGYAGVSEVSNIVNVTGDWNSIVEFAAVFGAMTPEVQDSTIAGRTIESGSEFHNTDRYEVELDNQEAAMKAAADAGFDQEGFTLTGNKIMFFNIFEYPVEDFDNKYITFVDKYTEYGGKIGSETKSAIQSEFIDSDRRAEIITKIEGNAVQQTGREGIRNAIQEAKPRNEEYRKLNELLTTDTNNQSNLEKVLDALSKIEGDLDQFGKETLGVNIPVVLAKAIVQAVKALVKAGITLEQAIKQVAADNNLSERDVNSLFNPTKVSEIDVNEVRSKARPGKRVSKGISVKTVGGKKVIEETDGLSLEYVKENAPKVFISNANIIAKYPLVAGKQKLREATTVEQAQEIYDVFVREVADNLNYLMDEFNPEFREISTLWYDGANAIANDFAERFDVSPEQAAGIIAAMSPQKDWYQNVRLAELVMMAYKDNPSLSQDMIDYQKQINQVGLYETATSPGKKLKKAEKAYKISRTKANKEAVDTAKSKMQKAINKANAVIKMLEQYKDKALNEVPGIVQPYMVRTYHEVNTTKDYDIVAPDGSIQGVAKKNNGENAKVAWGSYSEIGKAVAIKNDGSQENITRSLGEMHKIRNFYNNIIDPMSKDGDVTMDTHAIAAALLLPLSGNSTQVGQNFGTGTSNSAPLGIKGLYYAYADAYALAAKEAGLLPRQVQSITWEAVRGLYTDTFKGNKEQVAKINNIWKNYQDGKITINEAREQAKESAGGIKDPTWAGGSLQDESGAGVQPEGIGTGREGDGRNIVGTELGGEILTADTKDKTVLKKALDVLNKADQDLGKFGRETLGINIPVATMRAIIKLAKVLVKTGITLQEAIIKAAEQLNVSKEDALNAVKFMSETIKSPVKKVLVNEAAALKDQLRLEARAARSAKTDLNTKRKQITAFIRSLETKGTITARQAAALVKRVSSLNLDNQTMVDRFEKYAEKIFQRAEYQDLLTSAFKVRRLIRKAIKSENQAEVIGMAKLFSKIDPSLVDDIDNYIELANSVLNAIRPFKQNVKDPALRQAVDIATIAEYSTTEIAKQEKNRKRELMAEYKYLVDSGVLTEDLSVKEMQEIINLIEDPAAQFDPEANQKKINFLQNRLASMEAVFRYMLANNINPFTGEDVVIEAKDAELIKRLLKMDLNEISVREAAKVVEAMDNFLMNNITSGLEAAVRSYEGAQNAKQLVAQGKKARPLRAYFNKTIGRFFGEQLISLPLLFEKMFPGIKNAANIMQKMGLVDVINGSNKAVRQHNDLMTEYSKQDFYKEKGFMEAKNVYERGMLAFLKRNLTGTKTEVRDEFKRRAEIIRQSIEALRENGTDKEIEMADLYQEIYDKLGVSELDLDVIESNADQMNKDATDWMINEWGKIYGELADVSLSVYNSILGSDTNYTPDRYKNLSSEDKGIDEALLNSGSGFMMSMDYTDKNKTGVLMEATRPKVLPTNDLGKTTRYISLDFDVNNFNSLKGALVDINTAAAIRQIDGFINSRAFNKLIPSANDRALLAKRVNLYIQKAKGKRTISTDTIKDVERLTNFISGLGVGKALAGLDQPLKQTIPVMINTVINSGSTMTFVNADMNEAINRSGMPIANRGLESQTTVQSIDRLLEKKGGTGAEIIKWIEDANQFWLKTLLAKPDVWVARSSFITYYLKDMKSKGENVKDINWETHEWDQDSAEYAQIMVDRQQNISDDKLAGEFLSSEDPTRRIVRKVIMPFATFIMNQKARMHNDFLALRSKDSSIEDRKSAAKSLVGLGAELAAYQLIAYGIKTLVYDNIANYLVGDDDEEEKKDKSLFGLKLTSKQYSATKFPVKSIVADIISPLPLFDDLVTFSFDEVMKNFPQISDEDVKKAVEEKNTVLRLKGKDEMDDNTKAKFIDQLKSDNIYSVSFQNDSQGGRKYGMIGIAYDTYKEMIDLSRMAYTGEFEDEYQGRVTTKYLPEEDRKILQNISVPLMLAYSTGLLPKDLGTVARKVTNIVKKKGITENQNDKEKEVKDQIKRDLSDWEFELVKTLKKANGVVDEINYVESKGGLDNKQGKEYVKLMDVFPTPSDDMLRDIQNGMTADQIIKRNKE